ncbi:MAG: hypothetical protein FK731_14405 [Asgard group archaeon]|nr:hypothetical protein [Asgard group archaeon]
MTEKYYKCYNAETIIKIDPAKFILDEIKTTDLVLRFLSEINIELVSNYVSALKKRLEKEVDKFTIDTESLNFKSIENEISKLKQNDELTKLVIHYIAKSLKLPEDSKIASEIIEVTNYNRAFALERSSYYRVKAFTDILNKEKGIELYTKILGKIVTERHSKGKPNAEDTIKSANKSTIKQWCNDGIVDFTFTFIDDNQAIYRFDKCVTHEVLKDLNDPDVAYIASCFIGDIPEFNQGRIIHLRRTQTLHHADFCDELYWDSREFKKPPKQPTIEFTKNIGKEIKKGDN